MDWCLIRVCFPNALYARTIMHGSLPDVFHMLDNEPYNKKH